VRDLVAPGLLDRPKTAFRVPLGEWLRGPLATLLHDTFASRAMRQRGLFTTSALDELLRETTGTGGQIRATWNVFWLELWCQQYLDADPAANG
jgi:asparagine synthase (glutamine-hydrolysing)